MKSDQPNPDLFPIIVSLADDDVIPGLVIPERPTRWVTGWSIVSPATGWLWLVPTYDDPGSGWPAYRWLGSYPGGVVPANLAVSVTNRVPQPDTVPGLIEVARPDRPTITIEWLERSSPFRQTYGPTPEGRDDMRIADRYYDRIAGAVRVPDERVPTVMKWLRDRWAKMTAAAESVDANRLEERVTAIEAELRNLREQLLG